MRVYMAGIGLLLPHAGGTPRALESVRWGVGPNPCLVRDSCHLYAL